MLTSFSHIVAFLFWSITSLYRIVLSTFTGSATKVGRWRGGRQITYLSTFTGSATKNWGGGGRGSGRQIFNFFKFWNPIELILCPYHLFRMFPKVRSRYYHRKSPPKFFFSIFEAGDGGGGVTLNIIYGGEALNVDQLLTYCSTPILKHFTLYRIVLSNFTGSATKCGSNYDSLIVHTVAFPVSNFEIQLNWYYVRIIFSECFPRSGVDITTVNPPPPNSFF